MIDNTALQPCPFCGESEDIDFGVMTGTMRGLAYVQCQSCGAEIHGRVGTTKAISAWNRRAEPANEPMTLEELRGMDGEPLKHWAWIEVLPAYEHPTNYHIESAYYQAHSDCTKGKAFCCGYPGLGFHFKYQDYGKTWLAYRRKPEGSE